MDERSDSRILIATAIPLLASGFAGWIEGEATWGVCGVVTDGDSIAAILDAEQPDLVIVSALPGDAVDTAEIRTFATRSPVLVLAMAPNPDAEASLIRHGARAVLDARATKAECLRAVAALLSGQCLVRSEAVAVLTSQAAPAPLTERQRQLLLLLAAGRSTREIAQEMVVTESTVKTHVARLATRFGLSSRRELQVRAGDILADRGG